MEKIKIGFKQLIRWQYFPLLVLLLVVLGLHLATITRPNEPLFDEQHYVPDARRIVTGEGTLRVEHPPLAKLIIAGGIEIFGDNPWGWRMPAVLLSTIALIAFYDICRKLGTSHKTAFLATLLLGTENLMFIHSGMTMLDIFEVAFAIFAFWFYLKGSRWWWAAAVSVALAGLSKFSGILAIIPIGLHWMIIGYKHDMGNTVQQVSSQVPVVAQSPSQAPVVEQLPPQAPVVEQSASQITIVEQSTPVLESVSASAETVINSPSDTAQVVPSQAEPAKKRGFWATYSSPIVFILSMALAPIAFFLLYSVFEMVIWTKWIPFVVWGHWDQGIVGDIKNALTQTGSIKFSYDGAFPARPWEWILSPTGSFYFYGWLFHPENYKNIMLPYWYTPSYTGMLSPSLWLSGLAVIPYAVVKSFIRRNNPEKNAAIFVVCWIIGTWLVWVPLFLATNRITYMFYYLPTIGAIAIGTALILAGFLKRIEKRTGGFRKRFMQLGVTSFLLVHLLSFSILSPLHLWISIPVSAMLLLFALNYLGFGWRFTIQFYVAAAIATLIMRFVLYWPLKGWLVTGNAPWGLPEVSFLWVVSAVIGLAITWILFAIIHLAVNRIIRDNALPPQDAANPSPTDTIQP
ncbi:MAG: phospholipid carrier-dependent glycosyltransferase [Dehalococcoidia bacterium]|nr:MAG: phospholipid carrier-dependent glycosyltransferase [Dehalococcoidia bacterium]